MLRAATLPGADIVMPRSRAPARSAPALRPAAGWRASACTSEPRRAGGADGIATLGEEDACRAFLHTARSILDLGGQRVNASDRLYLAAGMPVLILWGRRDPMIPVAHAHAAHELMPHSRLEIFDDAGHFPFDDEPARFVSVLRASSPAASRRASTRPISRRAPAPPTARRSGSHEHRRPAESPALPKPRLRGVSHAIRRVRRGRSSPPCSSRRPRPAPRASAR